MTDSFLVLGTPEAPQISSRGNTLPVSSVRAVHSMEAEVQHNMETPSGVRDEMSDPMAKGEPGRDSQNGDGIDSVMASIEASLAKGIELVEKNPALAIIGVASIAAIVMIAVKSSSSSQVSTGRRLEREFKRVLHENSKRGSDLADTVSGALSEALNSRNMSGVRELAESWIAKLRP
jgi:hypothetical protein